MAERRIMGLVTAGGRSRRFGTPKAFHPVDGIPMAEHVYRVLSSVIRDVRLGLSGTNDAVPVSGAPIVFDDPPGAGPIGSLRAALLLAEAEWVVLAACDMPGLEREHVLQLTERLRPGLQAVVAADEAGDTHPLLACYAADSLPEIDAFMSTGRRSMRALVDRLTHETVVLGARAVWNVNRPEDLTPPPAPAST